jgi:hypothetical protein
MRSPRWSRRRSQTSNPADNADGFGGCWYELAIDLAPPDDARLDQAIRVLWELAELRECRVKVTRDPIHYESAVPSLIWRRPFDDWLPMAALRLFPVVPFEIALVGEESQGTSAWPIFSPRTRPTVGSGLSPLGTSPATTPSACVRPPRTQLKRVSRLQWPFAPHPSRLCSQRA